MNILKKCVSYCSHSSFLWVQILKYGYTREWKFIFYLLLKSCLRSIFWKFGICPRWLHFTLLPCHSLSIIVICYYSLSFVVTRCTTHFHSLYLSLFVLTRSHLLYLVVPVVLTRCKSLSLDVPLVCFFINDLLKMWSWKRGKLIIVRILRH